MERPQLGHIVSIGPPPRAQRISTSRLLVLRTPTQVGTSVPVSHMEPETVPSLGCTANTHPQDTSKFPQHTGRRGSSPSPSPCPPPSSAHPIPPSQSRSEPHRAGGPPHTSRVLPRSDLTAMSPELPQDRHMLSIIHRGSLGPWRLTPSNPTPQDLPTHTFQGRRGPKRSVCSWPWGALCRSVIRHTDVTAPHGSPLPSCLQSINPLLGPRQHLPPCPLALLPQTAQASPSGLCPSFSRPLLRVTRPQGW